MLYFFVLITRQDDAAQVMASIYRRENVQLSKASVHTDASQITQTLELGENLHVFFMNYLQTSQMGIVHQASGLVSQETTIESELSSIKMTNYFQLLKFSIHFKDFDQWTIVKFAEKLELVRNKIEESDPSYLIKSFNGCESFNIKNFNT